MNGNVRLRLLSLIVIAYMMLAFAWWSVLLYTKNQDAFEAKRELLKMGMVAEGLVSSEADFYQSNRYLNLEDQYRRQELMILGEATVFVISLVISIWLINRAYQKEVLTAQQQRNFLLSITHELKSPLASIRLVLDTLAKHKRLQPKQEEGLIRNGLQETERLHGLVNDLLLSARLESAYQPDRDRINLRELFQEVLSSLETKYPGADFCFEEKHPIENLRGDKAGLTSVAYNLLENAVKYSQDAPQVAVKVDTDNGHAVIEVADQGVGIPEKEKKRVFEKFYRVGNEDTRATKGTGLGLYIIHQIVKAHNGNIQVYDNQPKGTVFKIRLPLERESSPTKPKEHAHSTGGR